LKPADKIIKHKTGLLDLAEELRNVSKACRVIYQGKMCCGKTPLETMLEGKQFRKERFVIQT